MNIHRNRTVVLLASGVLPMVIAAALVPLRQAVENTNAALVLVLVVVAAASTGIRPAGIIAALSSTLSFDFFLTAPFNRLTITDRADVETAVLLILVGVGVTEVALWGRRQQARASSERGYLAGVLQTIGSVAAREAEPAELTERVANQLIEVLGLDACRFESDVSSAQYARLDRDGSVSRGGQRVNVDRFGLPTDTEIELIVRHGETVHGRYLLIASTRIQRPTLEQRQVAIALADQVGVGLAMAAG